jgi:hypothetical protein
MSDLYDTDVVIRSERRARAERPPPTDGELAAVAAIVTSAVVNLRSVTAASESPQRPRAMYFTPEQLAEAYRRAGLRNPRVRTDTTRARPWKKA